MVKHFLTRIIFTLALLSTTLLIDAPIAQAATFAVNDSGDAGDANPGNGVCATATNRCTLRAAIDETNALAGPNNITIPAMTIYLSSQLRIPDHVGDDSVLIFGAGQSQTILDGRGLTRVFYFDPRSGAHTISDLTIRNAINPLTTLADRNGGGIFNEATLTLNNVTVKDSRAFQGGGVYNQHAFIGPLGENIPALILRNVTLLNNTATATEIGYGGGGLFNGSVLDADGVVIQDNDAGIQGGGMYNNSYKTAIMRNFTVLNNTARDGGGVNNDMGSLTLEYGRIEGNISNCCRPPENYDTGGGGIYHNTGTLVIRSTLIAYNKATSPGGYGGGIYSAEILQLTKVSIIGNEANYGAGIANGNYNGVTNQLTITNSTISDNVGGYTPELDSEGGAIFNLNNGKTYIYSSTIARNTADATGGITNRDVNTRVELINTILASNSDIAGVPDCHGTIKSLGYNLITDPVGHSPYGLTCDFRYQSTDLLYASPTFGPLVITNLAYYPLLQSSLGVDAGQTSTCPTLDIRDAARPAGDSCDIGSYELQTDLAKVYLPFIRR